MQLTGLTLAEMSNLSGWNSSMAASMMQHSYQVSAAGAAAAKEMQLHSMDTSLQSKCS